MRIGTHPPSKTAEIFSTGLRPAALICRAKISALLHSALPQYWGVSAIFFLLIRDTPHVRQTTAPVAGYPRAFFLRAIPQSPAPGSRDRRRDRVPGCSACPAPETRCGRNGTPPDLSPNSRGTALAMSSIAGPLRSANWTSACLRLLLNCLERSSAMGVILPADWPSRGPRHARGSGGGAAAGIADVPFACPQGRSAP